MFRLMLALAGAALVSVFETQPGGEGEGGGGGEGSGEGDQTGRQPGDSGHGAYTLTETDLNNRRIAAENTERRRIAGLMGVSENEVDQEVQRLAQQQQQSGDSGQQSQQSGQEGGGEQQSGGEHNETIEQMRQRLEQLESAETQRAQQAREDQIGEGLVNALREAGAREDSLQALTRFATSFDLDLGDDGSITGTDEAVSSARDAFPNLFRGEGDTGQSPDAHGQRDGGQRPQNLQQALASHYNQQAS